MKRDDGLPQQLCQSCFDKIISFQNFRIQAEKSNYILHQILQSQQIYQIHNSHTQLESNPVNTEQSNLDEFVNSISSNIHIDVESIVKNESLRNFVGNSTVGGEESQSSLINIEEIQSDVEDNFINIENTEISTLDNVSDDHGRDDENDNDVDDELSDIVKNEINDIAKKLESQNDNEILTIPCTLQSNSLEVESIQESSNSEIRENDLFKNPNEPKECSICKKILANSTDLTKHRKENHGNKKFQCMECGNGFTTTRGLRIHLRSHTGEKPEICSICGKKFSDPRTRM